MIPKYKYDSTLNVIYADPTGELKVSEIGSYFEELLKDEAVKDEFFEVVRFNNVSKFMFSSEGGASIASLYGKLKRAKNVRATVLVAVSEFHFGMSRMIQALFEIHTPEHTVHIVRSEEEADAWVKGMNE